MMDASERPPFHLRSAAAPSARRRGDVHASIPPGAPDELERVLLHLSVAPERVRERREGPLGRGERDAGEVLAADNGHRQVGVAVRVTAFVAIPAVA